MSEINSETLREVTPSLADSKNYKIVAPLKEGRLFVADRAGKRFVLKTASDAKGLEMLKREYELSARLQHPFIASAIVWEDNTPVGPAIVIEYVRGRNLAEYLTEKPSLKARERVFGQILEAVGAIHRQSIIHNDIKPHNILITEADNDVKLIDFGFADADSHYLEKAMGGTRQYASPELLSNEITDARSDIYSIGILMGDLFPGRYRQIARNCTRPAPADRFQNVSELKSAWEKRNRPIWIWAALLLAVCATAAALIIRPSHPWADDSTTVRSDTVEIIRVDTVYASPAEAPAAVAPPAYGFAPTSASAPSSSPSDARTIDSLTRIINERDRKDAEDKAALDAAKAKVEAVLDRIVPAFRKSLAEAHIQNDVSQAWIVFTERMKEIYYDIPASTPESVAPSLREYITMRMNDVLLSLHGEMTSRLSELPVQ